jgi:hypothetical protein
VVIRNVNERIVTVEVAAPDETQAGRVWGSASVTSVLRVDGGWWGDWWDGEAPVVVHPDYLLWPASDRPDGDLLFAVPFHHCSVDSSGRGLTLFGNGYASCEPGPATADEQDDGVVVTVTECRPRGAISAAGAGRRSTVELGAPLGPRPVWDRRPGAVRLRA